MLTLTGKKIHLRALEPEDIEVLYDIENNEEFWEIGSTQTPFSKSLLKDYLKNAHRDIYEVKQLRLVICEKESQRVLGLVDLFDFDPANRRAGIGIIIAKEKDRGKGHGREALQLLCNYCFAHLKLHQVYANIGANNKKSQTLFEELGFSKVGLKKGWNLSHGKYQDEFLYQLIDVH